MRLEDYGEALAWDVAFWMQGVANPDYPLDELGDLSLEVSRKLRTLAIVTLLVKAETDFFYHDLIRSGLARETYLRRVDDAGRLDDYHRVSGRYDPLLDAVAAGDIALARRVAALSPVEFAAGREYEDDFCWAQLLHRLCDPAVTNDDLVPIMTRFDAWLDGRPSTRLAVARSLGARDQAGFDDAFEALLAERDVAIEEDKARGRLEEPHVVAARHVYVEGLALLRLAGMRGLVTAAEYRSCPALARLPMVAPFPGE
jgi:hypothetical protein